MAGRVPGHFSKDYLGIITMGQPALTLAALSKWSLREQGRSHDAFHCDFSCFDNQTLSSLPSLTSKAELQQCSIPWLTSSWTKLKPGTPVRSPMCVGVAKILGPFSTAFPSLLAGSWVGNRASGTLPSVTCDAGIRGNGLKYCQSPAVSC